DEGAHHRARRALAGVWLGGVPCRSGDVEVRPWDVACEVAQELAAGDRSRLARLGRVHEVGDLALHRLRVLGVQGQSPDQLAGRLAGGDDAFAPVVVV